MLTTWKGRMIGVDDMSWWNLIKSHPRLLELLGNKKEILVKLSNESEMLELWNASNPELQMQSRSSRGLSNYPIDTWFGLIKKVEGKPVLGAVGGYALRQGKEGKKFAYIGGIRGNRTKHFKGDASGKIRVKYLADLKGIPKIAGYTQMGKDAGFMSGEQPETHEVIPDEVLNFFKTSDRYDNRWDIKKNDSWIVWV